MIAFCSCRKSSRQFFSEPVQVLLLYPMHNTVCKSRDFLDKILDKAAHACQKIEKKTGVRLHNRLRWR